MKKLFILLSILICNCVHLHAMDVKKRIYGWPAMHVNVELQHLSEDEFYKNVIPKIPFWYPFTYTTRTFIPPTLVPISSVTIANDYGEKATIARPHMYKVIYNDSHDNLYYEGGRYGYDVWKIERSRGGRGLNVTFLRGGKEKINIVEFTYPALKVNQSFEDVIFKYEK